MEPTWSSPDAWQKDGASISSVSNVKRGAWTTILKATETHNGKNTEVVIKQFAVPEDVLQDPERIALEREKFLTAARLQVFLTTPPGGAAPARAWVKILRLDELSKNPSFSMEKCGPSVQDLIDNKVQMTPAQLYELVRSFLQGLIELKDRAKRSHGNIKPSDVLSALPGQRPAFKLADPAAKGEQHSANDLYSLGAIVFQLVEGTAYDPLNPIIPTRWGRFKAKRERWMRFCNMLLNPNGCHESLADVKHEAMRLRPSSAASMLAAVMGFVLLIGIGAVGYHFLVHSLWPLPWKKGGEVATTGSATGTAGTQVASTGIGGAGVATRDGGGQAATTGTATTGPIVTTGPAAGTQIATAPAIDPAVRAAFDAANHTDTDAWARWEALKLTPRYDHVKSSVLHAEAAGIVPRGTTFADNAAYRTATANLARSTAKLNDAIQAAQDEEIAGQKADAEALADMQKAAGEFESARSQWNEAVARFGANENHTRSMAAAREGLTGVKATAPTDPALAPEAAREYRNAASKVLAALKMIPDENASGTELAQAIATFEEARRGYNTLRDQWATAEQTKGVDLTAARGAAEEARRLLPDPVVVSDAASYRAMAATYDKAAQKMTAALALVPKEPVPATQQQTDLSAALSKGNQALADKKYAEALDWYKKAANLGNVPAMRNVGLFYENGQGAEKNETEAANWYRMAADQGSAAAMVDLAQLFTNGRGVDKDLARAAQFYRRAAELKYVAAMVPLGEFLDHGWGVKQDDAEAMKWYRQAADAGDAEGMNSVGVMYDQGRGVKVDPDEALKWYQKAAAKGNNHAKNNLGTFYFEGRNGTVDYAQAIKWFREAAEGNDPGALSNMGLMYDKGYGVKADPGEAMKWYQKAAALGSDAALYGIGNLYYDGRGVKSDLNQALEWYSKAAANKFGPALCAIGVMYDQGKGARMNHEKALQYFQDAADQNDGQAMVNLGIDYENGVGTGRDIVKAVNWYRQAYKSTDPEVRKQAMEALDRMKFAYQ